MWKTSMDGKTVLKIRHWSKNPGVLINIQLYKTAIIQDYSKSCDKLFFNKIPHLIIENQNVRLRTRMQRLSKRAAANCIPDKTQTNWKIENETKTLDAPRHGAVFDIKLHLNHDNTNYCNGKYNFFLNFSYY